MLDLDILFEDDAVIALHKPAGMLVHPSWIAPAKTPNCASMLKEYFNGGKVYTVHRLDRATSGVILFAKTKLAAQKLQQEFAERRVKKAYLAMVRGYADEEGVIDYALKEEIDKLEDKRTKTDKAAQDAVTRYKRIASVEIPIAVGRYSSARFSLVQCWPETGRKHQIRRHMKHIFHPIVGDTKHGDGKQNTFGREHLNIHRLMLMATDLEFIHPVSGEKAHIHAPLDDKTVELFQSLGWGDLGISGLGC